MTKVIDTTTVVQLLPEQPFFGVCAVFSHNSGRRMRDERLAMEEAVGIQDLRKR